MGRKPKKQGYPKHCYACEYRIDGFAEWNHRETPTPDVKGCKLRINDTEACRRWRDDERTARKLMSGIKGKRGKRVDGQHKKP